MNILNFKKLALASLLSAVLGASSLSAATLTEAQVTLEQSIVVLNEIKDKYSVDNLKIARDNGLISQARFLAFKPLVLLIARDINKNKVLYDKLLNSVKAMVISVDRFGSANLVQVASFTLPTDIDTMAAALADMAINFDANYIVELDALVDNLRIAMLTVAITGANLDPDVIFPEPVVIP